MCVKITRKKKQKSTMCAKSKDRNAEEEVFCVWKFFQWKFSLKYDREEKKYRKLIMMTKTLTFLLFKSADADFRSLKSFSYVQRKIWKKSKKIDI